MKTLQRWEESGKIKLTHTVGGHRRYNITNLIGNKTGSELTIGYARVSSHDQKEDLARLILV